MGIKQTLAEIVIDIKAFYRPGKGFTKEELLKKGFKTTNSPDILYLKNKGKRVFYQRKGDYFEETKANPTLNSLGYSRHL